MSGDNVETCGRRTSGRARVCTEPLGHGRVGAGGYWYDHHSRAEAGNPDMWWGRQSATKDLPDGPPLTGLVNGYFHRDPDTGHVSLEQAVTIAMEAAVEVGHRAVDRPDSDDPEFDRALRALMGYLRDWQRGAHTPVTVEARAERERFWTEALGEWYAREPDEDPTSETAVRRARLDAAVRHRAAAMLADYWGEYRPDEQFSQVLGWLRADSTSADGDTAATEEGPVNFVRRSAYDAVVADRDSLRAARDHLKAENARLRRVMSGVQTALADYALTAP